MAKAARRSIDALFTPSQPTGVEDMDNARTIAVDLLESNPYQPRRTFDDAALVELADDIEAHGVLQPLLVRPHPQERGRYQVVAGERRWRAARLAGLTQVPCIERDMDDSAMERLALVENVQRADLNPVDEAHAYKRLMERLGLSQRELAETIHKDQSYIVLRLRLIEDPRIEAVVRAGKMSPTVGQEAARVADPDRRAKIIDQAERGERVRVQDVKAVRGPEQTKPRCADPSHSEAPTSGVSAPVMNNSSDGREEAVSSHDPHDALALPSMPVRALYSAFQDWRARVYGEMVGLSKDQRHELRRLLRTDIVQLLDRLDDGDGGTDEGIVRR